MARCSTKKTSDAALLLCATLLISTAGCGGASGPERFELSGNITYRGKPVPAGTISFTPDSAKKNLGPGTSCDIVQGRYQTRPDQGTIGGPHKATITGFDGKPFQDGPMTNPNGKPLFAPQKIDVDLPKAVGTRDFALPSAAEK